MFMINHAGRVVGLPYEMEEMGFKQAKEVLSISSELMERGTVIKGSNMAVVKTKGMVDLKNQILARFPNVVTDEEYLAKQGAPEVDQEVQVKTEEKIIEEIEKEKKELEEKLEKERQKEEVIEEEEKVEEEEEEVLIPKPEAQIIEGKPKRRPRGQEKSIAELYEEMQREEKENDVNAKPPMIVKEEMTLKRILEAADFYNIPLKSTEKKYAKAKVIELMYERYKG
jgi:hypothetical protein